MASNFNQRSNSSGSRARGTRRSSRSAMSSRGGRPPRDNRARLQSQRGTLGGSRGSSPKSFRQDTLPVSSSPSRTRSHARNTRPGPVFANSQVGRRTSRYGSSLPNIDQPRNDSNPYRNSVNNPSLRGGGAPLRSVSVSSVRTTRRNARPKRHSKALLILIITLVIILALTVTFFILSRTSVFSITSITVSGSEHMTNEEITQVAAVPEGSTLLNVDGDGIEGRLESQPWIEAAEIERVFPDTLNLKIHERTIDAVVDVIIDDNDNQQTWALASDGTWLMEIPDRNSQEGQQIADKVYEDADAVLHIASVPYNEIPQAGTQVDNPNISNALEIIDGMTTELSDQVKTVSAASPDSTVLTLDSGVEIAFGSSEDIRDKERVCLELMEKYPGQIAYINVRTVNKPVWRAV